MRRIAATGISLLAAFVLAGEAKAVGGDYAFVGGSDAARAAVRSALDASRFDWDLVEAHQVDFFLLDARDRRRVRQWLGGSDWCYEDLDVDHDDHACERFASSLAWAYWPRHRRNIMAVHTAVTAGEFREMLPRLLGPDDESIASQGLPRRRSSPTLRQVS